MNVPMRADRAGALFVVALINTSQTRNGRSFNGEAVIVFHVRDGKITEAWTIVTDAYGFDEFWAD